MKLDFMYSVATNRVEWEEHQHFGSAWVRARGCRALVDHRHDIRMPELLVRRNLLLGLVDLAAAVAHHALQRIQLGRGAVHRQIDVA